MLNETKAQIIKEFQINEKDTGSVEVQVALLTQKINALTEHFNAHPKDFGSKRGLLLMVSQRRSFLKYLQNHDKVKYKQIVDKLGLRK